MAERKTVPTDNDVQAFLDGIPDESQREDSAQLLEMMTRLSGGPGVMYGPSIVGFGRSVVTYANGKQDDWFSVGFSPRKGKLSLYVVDDAAEHKEVLDRLGPHKHGKSCIWVKRLADIEMPVLEEVIAGAIAKDRERGYM